SIPETLKEANSTLEVTGTASATVRLSGTVDQPQAEIAADVSNPAAFGESISRLQTTVRYRANLLEVVTGEAFDGNSSIRFSGSFKPFTGDWKSGELTIDAATQGLPVTRFEHVATMKPMLDGTLTGRIRGTARLANNEIAPLNVASDLAID